MRVYQKKIDKEIRQAFLNYVFLEAIGISFEKLEISKNLYGKPEVKNISNIKFNISHCNGVIACVIANRDIGIDIEEIRDFNIYAAKKVCTETELNEINTSQNPNRTFFSYWTLKESLGKALGVGLHYPIKENEFKFSRDKIFSSYKGLIFKQFEVYENYLISICMHEDEEKIELKEVKISGRRFY